MAAHAAEDDIAALATYGHEVGSAFQIVDDISDFVGDDPAHIGKPVGGDLRQGLVTLPTLCYMEERPHDADVRALLNGRMGDAAITARVVEAVRASNAIRAALAEARQFVARGLSALDTLPPGQPVESLRRLAEYVVSRDL